MLPCHDLHSPGSITGAKIAVHISISLWMSEPHFDELMGLLDRFPGTVDELAFFSHITHAPLLLDEHERRMQILAQIMPVVRARGKSAGINLLKTIGHHEEYLAGSLDMPWQRFIAPDGRVCRGCYCPLDDHVQKYIRDHILAMIADRRLEVADLISHRLPADEAQAGYRLLPERRDDALGVILEWPKY